MGATAVCGDCNAVVGMDAAACDECGRVFPPRPARKRKPVGSEFNATQYGMMAIIALAVSALTFLLWRDPDQVAGRQLYAMALAGAFVPLLVAQLALMHRPRTAWFAFLLTLAAISGWRIASVSHAIDDQREARAAQAEFRDAMHQLQERHRLFLLREDTGEVLASGKPVVVRAATSTNEMYYLLAGVLRANSDRAMQLHSAWQGKIGAMRELMSPQLFTSRKGIAEFREVVADFRAANASLATDEQALRVQVLAQAGMIVGARPERGEVMQRIEADLKERGTQMARLSQWQETQAVLVDDMLAFMARRSGHVSYRNGMLLFDDPRDLATFNGFIDRSFELDHESRRLRTEMAGALDHSL